MTNLFLPDYIDGERQGLALNMVQSETTASAAEFNGHRDEESTGDSSCSSTDETDSSLTRDMVTVDGNGK